METRVSTMNFWAVRVVPVGSIWVALGAPQTLLFLDETGARTPPSCHRLDSAVDAPLVRLGPEMVRI